MKRAPSLAAPGSIDVSNSMLVAVVALLVLGAGGGIWASKTFFQATSTFQGANTQGSFYDLKTSTLGGQPADLASYRGKVALVVNVASKCGFTPQYQGLERLYRDFSPRGFTVLGFPSNDFGGQEPGTAEEIQTFCKLTYDVTFPLFSKVVTKAGDGQSPIYAFLGQSGSLPQWNFSKYVIGRDGKIRAFFPSRTAPDDPALRAAIEDALAAR
jgi:glutathione peroxidase